MSASAVAQHVDDDVLVEFLTEIDGQTGYPGAGFRVVAVDVEDRRTDHLGDVGAVFAGSGELRRGGETDLVVDDDVDGAADAVSGQIRQVQRLGHHALSGEGRVTVQHQRDHGELRVSGGFVAGIALQHVLLGSNQALEDGVDCFEMGRICRQ